jgi:hypothetical protein
VSTMSLRTIGLFEKLISYKAQYCHEINSKQVPLGKDKDNLEKRVQQICENVK